MDTDNTNTAGADSSSIPPARDERLANSVKTTLTPLNPNIDPDAEPGATHPYGRNIPNVHTDMESTGTSLDMTNAEDRPLPEAVAYHDDAVERFAERKKQDANASVYLLYIVGVLILINIAVIAIARIF